MDYKRKSDNLNRVNTITSIVIAIAIFILGYIIIPMESRINNRLDRMEQKQEQQVDKFINYYNQCKDDVHKVREDYQRDIGKAVDKVMDKIYALFDKNGKNKS